MVNKQTLLFLFVFCFGISSSCFAQKDLFDKAEKFNTDSVSQFIKNRHFSIQWIDSSAYFYYRLEKKDDTIFFLGNAKKASKEFMFSNSTLQEALKKAGNDSTKVAAWKLYSLDLDPKHPNEVYFSFQSEVYQYNWKKKTIKKASIRKEKSKTTPVLTKSSAPYWQKHSTDSSYFIYGLNHTLFLQKKDDKEAVALTQSGERYNSFVTSSDTENEKETSPMVYWMKGSKKLVALKEDKRAVGEMTIINSLKKPRPETRTYKFPMPGDSAVSTYELYVWDAERKSSTQIDINKYPDQRIILPGQLVNGRTYLFADRMGDHERYVYFLRRSRTNDQVDLCRLDTQQEIVEELITETTTPHVNEQLFTVKLINGGKEILWWSERSGYGTYYRYDQSGKLLNSLGNGDFVSGQIIEIDSIGKRIIMEAYGYDNSNNPYYRQYVSVNWDGTNMRLLTPENAYHNLQLSPNGTYFLNSFSTMNEAPTHQLKRKEGKKVMDLERSDLTALKQAGWKAPELIKLKAEDGQTDLYGLLYTPFDLDSTKKYPVISNVYPGPQEDFVPRQFTINDNANQTLAELGFIVVQIPSRGTSPYRGLVFHSHSYGNMRDYALADDKNSIEELAKTRPFMDMDRVGIYGHSGGGFMSATAILTYPDFYKVAVAASGNYDPNIYTQWWGETYHGVQQTEKGFESTIPTAVSLAGNLKGRLLLITGDVDPNVHPANTFRMADELIKHNKRFDMMVLPGKDHGLGDSYYLNLIRYYFLENLVRPEKVDIDIVNHK